MSNMNNYHQTPDCVGDWIPRMYLGTKCLICEICGTQVLADRQTTTAAKFENNMGVILLQLSYEGTAILGIGPEPKNRLKGLV